MTAPVALFDELQTARRAARLQAVGAGGRSVIAVPGGVRSVIPDDAPKCTAEPDESSTRSVTEPVKRRHVGAGEVVVEDLGVAPAVLGVAERAVLRHADAVPPAVAGQREHRRALCRGRNRERQGRRNARRDSSRHADTIGRRVPRLELCAGKDVAADGNGSAGRLDLQRVTRAVDNLRDMGLLSALPKPVRTVLETVVTLVVALGIAWLGQAFVVKPYRVPTPSMVPTLEPGDRVLADRLSLDFENPGRGQIVVFHPPHCTSGHNDSTGVCTTTQLKFRDGLADTTFVKRVIGLPGETVWATGGHVWIKDKGKPAFQLNEPYTHGKTTNDLPRETIPKGYYLHARRQPDRSRTTRASGASSRAPA